MRLKEQLEYARSSYSEWSAEADTFKYILSCLNYIKPPKDAIYVPPLERGGPDLGWIEWNFRGESWKWEIIIAPMHKCNWLFILVGLKWSKAAHCRLVDMDPESGWDIIER